MTTLTFLLILMLAIAGYVWNRRAADAIRAGGTRLHSISQFHAMYSTLSIVSPMVPFVLIWLLLQGPSIDYLAMSGLPESETKDLSIGQRQLVLSEVKSIAGGRIFGEPEEWKLRAASEYNRMHDIASQMMLGIVAILSLAILFRSRRQVGAEFKARQGAERIVSILMIACSVVAIITTIGIIASLVVETARFLSLVPLTEFLFGLNWEPQIPMREDQIAAAGAFGWVPVILGTLVITFVALFISVPVGLMSAIYLNEFAPRMMRAVSKPILEILAGVPTVVYGFFAILVVAPAIRNTGASFGIDVAPNTALAAGGVMGVMLIPFISSFTDDALTAVPNSLRDGSLALGATRAETVVKVMFPAAIPGIVGGILLAVSRAIGETMIVVMAAGLIAKITFNPLDSVTTVTVQIVTLLIGDTAFDNPKTLAAFALGMMLFLVTLLINLFALRIVQKYREIYD